MLNSGSEIWRYDLVDGFSLRDAAGCLVRLPYSKVEEILLAIAEAAPAPVSRQLLAETLWPLVDDTTRLARLRQALSQLKKSLGEQRVWISRTHCGLHNGFSLSVDCLPAIPARTPQLQPFLQTAAYLEENTPHLLLEFLISSHEMMPFLPFSELIDLMGRAERKTSPNDPRSRWIYLWKGSAYLYSQNIGTSRHLLRRSWRMALEANDRHLIVVAGQRWGIAEILSGNPEKGLRIAQALESNLQSEHSVEALLVSELKGSAYLHQGRNDAALKVLDTFARHSDETSDDKFCHESMRALYHATVGNLAAAIKAIELPMSAPASLMSSGVEVLRDLAEAHIQFLFDPATAVLHFQRLTQKCESFRLLHYGIYAHEGLARALAQERRFPEANAAFKKSIKARKDAGFCYTSWDRMRLQRTV